MRALRMALPIVLGAFLIASLGACQVAGDKGSTGKDGAAGATGDTGEPGATPFFDPEAATITITGVDPSNWKVNFTVEDENGNGLRGLTLADFRFMIAELIPATSSEPSYWNSYLRQVEKVESGDPGTEGDSAPQPGSEGGSFGGNLVDHTDGSYSYTFNIDPSTDNKYHASYTHRVAIYLSSSDLGDITSNDTYDIRPSDGKTSGITSRNIVKTANCNECHNKLAVHGGSRTDTNLCVTCHNSTKVSGKQFADANSGNVIDFKVMIHKIHRGRTLPSVESTSSYPTVDQNQYIIYGYHSSEHNFSEVGFPQKVNNCTKCHTGTSEADNYVNVPSMEACGACHDDVNFSHDNSGGDTFAPAYGQCVDDRGTGTSSDDVTTPITDGDVSLSTGTSTPYETTCTVVGSTGTVTYEGEALHPGGKQTSNAGCTGCHQDGGLAGSPSVTVVRDGATVDGSHADRTLGLAKYFQFNVLDVTDLSDGQIDTGDQLKIVFSITNPVDGTWYDPRSTASGSLPFQSSQASVSAIIGWDSSDYYNVGTAALYTTNPTPANANYATSGQGTDNNTDLKISAGTQEASPVCPAASVTYNIYSTECTFSITTHVTVPAGVTSIGVGIYGRVGGLKTGGDDTVKGDYSVQVPVKATVEYFGVNGEDPVERREVVNITAKCDNCHGTLSLHGGSRTDEGQVCVMCHNPMNTDVGNRLAQDHTLNVDGKKEESIDFKRMIHGIHGAGKRETPITIYGYGGSVNTFDEEEVTFPGILNRCDTCHVEDEDGLGTYELVKDDGTLRLAGVLPSTIDSAPSITDKPSQPDAGWNTAIQDQTDNDLITPNAAVCSACHDSLLAGWHMIQNGAGFGIDATEWNDGDGTPGTYVETCALCHGPGRVADLKVVHGIPD